MAETPTLLTVPEAAKLLRIGRNTAYQLIARGALPHVRLGHLIRVPRASLDRWLEEHACVPPAIDNDDGSAVHFSHHVSRK